MRNLVCLIWVHNTPGKGIYRHESRWWSSAQGNSPCFSNMDCIETITEFFIFIFFSLIEHSVSALPKSPHIYYLLKKLALILHPLYRHLKNLPHLQVIYSCTCFITEELDPYFTGERKGTF